VADDPSSRMPGEVEEGLTIKGDLGESGLPELQKSFTQNQETGILTLSSAGVDKSIHLKDGKVLFAASTDPDDRLGEVLLRSGKITIEQYFESAQHIRPGRRQGEILVELGYITPDDLIRGVRRQVMHIIYTLFQWTRGEYKMVLKDLDTHDLVMLNLSTPEIIFEGVRRIQAWSRIYRGIGASMDTLLARTPEGESVVYQMELGEDESHLFGLAAGRLTIQQICSMSYLSNFETCKALWGFLCVGALAPVVKEAAPPREAKKAPAETQELRRVVRRYVRAFDHLKEALGGEGKGRFPAFLQGALLRVQEQHTDILGGFVPARPPAEQIVESAQALEAAPAPGRPARLEEGLQDLLYAILLLVKVKRGPEEERRISEEITRILHSAGDE